MSPDSLFQGHGPAVENEQLLTVTSFSLPLNITFNI